MTYQLSETPRAWLFAKRITALIGVILLLEMMYFVATASSSLEITVICIVLFAMIGNIPILYNLYKSTD
ncbi:hypothetical protein ACFSJU_00185 [Paradesertivirga mongoliensis]|uniref:Uncharacterized protein n=1 Tax=Paradesertivirga mongoliensis TaxID=2100740 RepID=A0ABW4ZFK7_9SPHI|nr:hypothetical protein [Pedobacter mongoliensis]